MSLDGGSICPTSWSFSRGIRSCVQSLPLPCSHGVLASFEAKRIMIIMIYDILRLTILSSHSLPKPGCMLVYRFPKMPSMFTSMSNVMPNKSSHVCFSHILHSYISLLIFRPIMTQWEKMFAQRSLVSFKLWVRFGSLVLFCPNEKRGFWMSPQKPGICISVC